MLRGTVRGYDYSLRFAADGYDLMTTMDACTLPMRPTPNTPYL
jgi:hypothetical protein